MTPLGALIFVVVWALLIVVGWALARIAALSDRDLERNRPPVLWSTDGTDDER